MQSNGPQARQEGRAADGEGGVMGDVALGEMRQESACCPGRKEKFAKGLDLNQTLGDILKKKIGGRMESAPAKSVKPRIAAA